MTTTTQPPAGGLRSDSTAETRTAPPDITALPRAVISAAFEVLHRVERAVGAGPVRTARDNAWEAVCADRARARQREEIRAVVARLSRSSAGPASAGPASAGPASAGPASAGPSSFRPAPRKQPVVAQSTVGSSPRSSASHAATVPAPATGPAAPAVPAGRVLDAVARRS